MRTKPAPASQPAAVDAYLAQYEGPVRARLDALRALVRAEAPDAVERMAYGLPTWWQGENLVHVGAFAKHVGLYPGARAIEVFADALADFKTSKGAIQLPHERPLPIERVRDIVRWRVAQAASAAGQRP